MPDFLIIENDTEQHVKSCQDHTRKQMLTSRLLWGRGIVCFKLIQCEKKNLYISGEFIQ